jgi:hypothetical protein
MTDSLSLRSSRRRRTVIWMAIGVGLLLVIGANTHLVYVAVTSEPGCVAHTRPGETQQPGSFGAAQSDCSMPEGQRAE